MNMRIGLEIGDGFFFYGSVIAHKVMDVTAGVRNSINLFTHASNYELLAKHEKAVERVQHPVGVRKMRAKKREKERKTDGKGECGS